MRILVVRTDRIGDLIVSTPVFKALKDAYPSCHITALVRTYTKGLLVNNPNVDEIIVYDSSERKSGLKGFLELVKLVKSKNFDVAVVLFSNFRIGLLTFLASIPKRIAPATKIAQFFYTERVVQRRSKAIKHEADYNLDLLATFGVENVNKEVGLWVNDKSEEASFEYLQKEGLTEAWTNSKLIGIHPGCGDSAKNWEPERYAQLADRLISENGYSVILSGSPGEAALLSSIKEMMHNEPSIYKSGGILDFAALLKKTSVFVSSSTGPMHMAAAVGTPTVSIFCPIRVCTPIRWGPIGNKQHILLPDVPQCEKCIKEECEHYNCMEKISIDSVLNCVTDLAGQH